MSVEPQFQKTGLGDVNAKLNVYTANRPPLSEYEALEEIRSLYEGEIKFIADQTGNHWRKIFNVYAKFIFELDKKLNCFDAHQFGYWQDYRDQRLLQTDSNTALLFNAPVLSENDAVHIVMGKGYFSELGYDPDKIEGMVWQGIEGGWQDFAIWPDKKLIMCPYFDYRQLSNIKIDQLVELVNSL